MATGAAAAVGQAEATEGAQEVGSEGAEAEGAAGWVVAGSAAEEETGKLHKPRKRTHPTSATAVHAPMTGRRLVITLSTLPSPAALAFV